MARDNTITGVMATINKNGKGKPYEDIMSGVLAAYCVRNGLDHRIVTGTREDWFGGTDFRIYSDLDILTADSEILRFDFTSAFSAKDNMPLIWTPEHQIMQLPNRPIQFGIRTGNKTKGLDYPVIVVGIDASQNKDPGDNVDIELLRNIIRENTSKYAASIISEAGSALSMYVQMTRPEYIDWLQSEEAAELDLMPPGQNRLMPNYNGIQYFDTRTPSAETRHGIRAARTLAADMMASKKPGTPSYERARAFIAGTKNIADVKTSPPGTRSKKMAWLMRLAEKQTELRKPDPQDGPPGPK